MKLNKPLKFGRPTKYKPEYCEDLIRHLEGANSFESFAAKVDTCVDTLYEWEKVHPDFSEAKRRGVAKSLLVYENFLKNAMTNRNLNLTAIIYSMRVRFAKFGYNLGTTSSVNAGDDFEFK